MHRTKILDGFFGQWRKRHIGGHDLVRRRDRQGETLIWCRKCSGYARQRIGPKLMNCCRPEQVSTKEHGKMLKRIQILEDGRVPANKAKIGKLKDKKRRSTRKEYQRLLKWKVSWRKKDCGISQETKPETPSESFRQCMTIIS